MDRLRIQDAVKIFRLFPNAGENWYIRTGLREEAERWFRNTVRALPQERANKWILDHMRPAPHSVTVFEMGFGGVNVLVTECLGFDAPDSNEIRIGAVPCIVRRHDIDNLSPINDPMIWATGSNEEVEAVQIA